MGEGYGFRKIRRAIGVTAFGINALVLPPGYETGVHYHDEQEELYFVHQGVVRVSLRRRLPPRGGTGRRREGGREHRTGGCATPARATRSS